MIGQMANAIAFPRFNHLGRTVTPSFLSRNRFCLVLGGKYMYQIDFLVHEFDLNLDATYGAFSGSKLSV